MQPKIIENDREAQFLAAQSARLANVYKHGTQDVDEFSNEKETIISTDGTVRNKRDGFWFSFKDECLSLSTRLDALNCKDDESGKIGTMYVTAQQRNAALSMLQDIQMVLRTLQHYINNVNNLNVVGHEFLPPQFKGHSMPDLPVADQRLVNIEIQTLKKKSQIVNNLICPKEKFRFRRYRALLDKRKTIKQNIEEELDDDISSYKEEDQNSERGSIDIKFNGTTLAEKTNCKLVVNSDGTIKYMNSAVSDDVKLKSNAAKSFLARKLENCEIAIEGTYESMHIIDVKNTALRIISPIKGPVHVTNCHNTQIYIGFARQLRIHNCSKVSFECHVASGPIIEECTNMEFHQKDFIPKEASDSIDDQNLYWDVKDFQWLKTLVKSPNFEVFSHRKEVDLDVSNGQHDTRIAVSNDNEDLLTAEQDDGRPQDESSDEDEL